MEGMAQQPSSGKQNKMAQLRYGVWNSPGEHAGKTVSQFRAENAKMWTLPEEASAFIGKTKLDENYVIQPGDNIEFHRRSGEKG